MTIALDIPVSNSLLDNIYVKLSTKSQNLHVKEEFLPL